MTILIYGVVFHNPCLCESDLTYGMQRYVAGSRALYAPERRLPLSNRVAICLSRIEAEVGTHERVDTAGGRIGSGARGNVFGHGLWDAT